MSDLQMINVDGRFLPTAEYKLRLLLASRSGISNMYWDDGEAQGQYGGISIDFVRDSVESIAKTFW